MINNLWLMEPGHLKTYLEQIAKFSVADIVALEAKSIFDEPTAQERIDAVLSIEGNTAKVFIKGVLSPNGPGLIERLFGIDATSFNDLQRAAQVISDDDDITDVILMIDSPGGTIDGTDNTFQAFKALSKKKTIRAEVQNTMASAAYWIGMSAGHIVATGPSAVSGSIGVVFVGFDFSERLQTLGIQQVILRSESSPDKIGALEADNAIEIIQREVDALGRIFVARVAGARGISEQTVIDKFGKGAVLVAQDPDGKKADALSVGMIDEVISPIGSKNTVKNKDRKTVKGGDKVMTLAEFLSENPTANADHQQLLKAQHDAGFTAGAANVQKRVEAASEYIGNENYPKSVAKMALEVITGECEAGGLRALVHMCDAQKEMDASNDATTDGDGKETAAISPEASTEGVVSSGDDASAAAARISNKPKDGGK